MNTRPAAADQAPQTSRADAQRRADASLHTAYIGIGANLGDAAATVRRAIATLESTPGIVECVAARLYLSSPVDADGPDYINTVVRIRTVLDAFSLLDQLQAVEQAHGRTRPYRNAPRTLDLDLLLFDEAEIRSERLQVPHPRMHQRAFVLVPLAELAPALMLKQGSVGELAQALESVQTIRCLS